MIKFNRIYKVGKQEVVFQENQDGAVYASYGEESIEGKMVGNTLKGIFQNNKVNVTGVMELTFHETGFEGRWKKGLEPGELKQKWNAILVESKEEIVSMGLVKTGFHVFTDEDGVRYEGEWNNDIFLKGKAESVDEDGEKIIEEGDFIDFMLSSGKVTYEDGSFDEGDFDEDGMLHGSGKQTYFDEDSGQVIEEGIFEQGILKEGKITWADGNTASGTFDEELELNGKGIYTWENGDFQDGTWVHGEFKDGKAKITHDDGEILEGMMKDGEWEEEEVLNSDELLLSKSFQVGDKVHLPITQMGVELDFEKIDSGIGNINLALSEGQFFLYITFAMISDKIYYEGDEIPLTDEQILYGLNNKLVKKGNPFWKDDLILFDKDNLNSAFYEKIKSEIEFNQTSQKLSVDHETNLIGSQDRPEKSPIRSLAANMNKLFDKQDYEGVCIYADLSREYPNDVFDKILISAVKTLNNEIFNECKSKFDARDIIWDFEGENRKFKVKWLLFFDENKKLLNKNNEIKLFNDLKKYENEIKEEILIVNTRVYKSIEFDSGAKYNGEMLDHKRNGKGIYTWPNGQRYEGDFLNDNYHGIGKLFQSNGAWKEGKWENDEFISGKVFITYDSGNTYDGYFSNNNRNGEGCYTWSDGTKYTGNFLNGERSGKGIYTNPDGKKYTGNFLNGNFHGYGKMTWSNGDYFEGNWENGKRLGKTSFELKEEQKQREEDERRYSEEIARREQEELRHNEEKAKREADELERKKVQEKKKVEEAEEKERKKKQEAEEKTKSRYFEITYKIKLKEDKHQTHVAGGILDFIVMGGMSKTEKTHGKGQLIQRTIRVSHEGQTLSDSSAKNYIVQKDADVKSGKAGTSTITIIKIK